VGYHPIQAYTPEEWKEAEQFDVARYRELLASSEKIVAIGETGLDTFHLSNTSFGHRILDMQRRVYREQSILAVEHDLPLVMHVRDAHGEMIKVIDKLRAEGIETRGVVHCFTGTRAEGEAYLERGYSIGFTGVVTFSPKKKDPKAQHEVWDLIKHIPADRLLIETDAPFLAPEPYRGKRAESWMVTEVAKKVAELRNSSYEDICTLTANNAMDLFGINT
jgi:TatD DNase family protein